MHRSSLVGFKQQFFHFILNTLIFTLCYQTANQMAAQKQVYQTIALHIDRSMPFIEWMIIPYLSSGIFFTALFFVPKTRDSLRLFSQRIILTTLCATVVFMLYPLHFSLPRPDVSTPVLASLFQLLAWGDQPYNQFPSLHVAYALIFWATCRAQCAAWSQRAIACWLLLLASSTVLIYQHHLLDVLGGALLGLGVLRIIRNGQSPVAFCYLAASVLMILFGLLVYGVWLSLWLALCFALISLAYFRQQHDFLRKRAGRHTWLTWLLYAPYLMGYLMTWLFVIRWYRYTPQFWQAAPQLLIGRRLTMREAIALHSEIVVIDLSGELSETSSLRSRRYLHFPILDLSVPDTQYLHQITQAIRDEIDQGATVYLHCAMGLSRCRLVAEFYSSQLEHYSGPSKTDSYLRKRMPRQPMASK